MPSEGHFTEQMSLSEMCSVLYKECLEPTFRCLSGLFEVLYYTGREDVVETKENQKKILSVMCATGFAVAHDRRTFCRTTQ